MYHHLSAKQPFWTFRRCEFHFAAPSRLPRQQQDRETKHQNDADEQEVHQRWAPRGKIVYRTTLKEADDERGAVSLVAALSHFQVISGGAGEDA